MNTYLEPHPDRLNDIRIAREVNRGSYQALEDKALKAYHDALAAGKSKEEASQIYFETFQPLKP